jgi:long-subunit acyl-CoA synthetase (AMP-forming)
MADPRWPGLRPPSLKTITHSGSRLSAKATDWLGQEARRGGLQTIKMYGMTEATARLSVLPAEDFPAHAGAVGRAVAGGGFEIDAGGQIVYHGPNVMMGYAESRADLSLGDQLQGRLETGDTGWLDECGRLTITGRLRRFAKILGLRLNLADMEDYLSGMVDAAIVSDDRRIVVYLALAPQTPIDALRAKFCAEFRLPPQTVDWRRLDRLPRAETGKVLYHQLAC